MTLFHAQPYPNETQFRELVHSLLTESFVHHGVEVLEPREVEEAPLEQNRPDQRNTDDGVDHRDDTTGGSLRVVVTVP